MTRNLHKEITDKIIAQLQQGVVPWRKPWSGKAIGSAMPRNAITNRAYSGINVMLLWGAAEDKGYQQNAWMTYKQAQERGGNVRKGEKGEGIVFVGAKEIIDEETGKKKKILFLKSYTVFNVEQCEGVTLPTAEPVLLSDLERNALADEFIKSTQADVRHGGNRAYYSQGLDYIQLPPFASFKSADEYYSTAFHELTHWTGNKARLDRTFGKRFGDSTYAAEELVAELGAAFACAEFGFNNEGNAACGTLQNSAAYIDNWLGVLGKNDRLIVEAAAKASRAIDFMRGLALAEEEDLREAA